MATPSRLISLANLDNDPVNEMQSLTIKGDSLSISDGNTVKIDFPVNLDNDTTNEIQTISLTNDTIHLSKGGSKIALEELNKYIQKSQDSMKFVPLEELLVLIPLLIGYAHNQQIV